VRSPCLLHLARVHPAFSRMLCCLNDCRYYQEKGFWVIVTARVLNLLALGFTAAFSGFLLLWVNWGALRAECIQQDTCDILEVRSRQRTLSM
jgi:Autophagy protein ATG9